MLLLDNIAYARLEIDHNEAFEKLVCFNDSLAKWVTENNPEHWAMSKFLKKRWDKMTTNIVESFNVWLRDKRHQTIYTLLLMHMDKLVAMLDTHMHGTQKWKSVVGPKIEEKLMSNITRSGPISVLPYLGETFKVFTGEVYFGCRYQSTYVYLHDMENVQLAMFTRMCCHPHTETQHV